MALKVMDAGSDEHRQSSTSTTGAMSVVVIGRRVYIRHAPFQRRGTNRIPRR
jgi:hypothetical protein